MAPLLISYGQELVDQYFKDQMVKEYLAEQATSTIPSPAIEMADDSSLDIDNSISHESNDVSLDQSNNGFSFVNIHWASFSTGLSSVLAVVLAGLFIAGCCYFHRPLLRLLFVRFMWPPRMRHFLRKVVPSAS